MTMLDQLLAALAGAPALPGARCRFKSHLFDEARIGEGRDTVAQRHRQAIGLCEHCPSLQRCSDWYAALPRRQRPAGVVAGRIRGNPVGRPKASAS